MSITTTLSEKSYIGSQIRSLGAQRVLEIGCFKGETTRRLSEAVSVDGGVVVAIDPMTWGSEIVSNGISRYLPERFHRGLESLSSLLPKLSYENAFWQEVHQGGRNNVRLFRALSTSPALIANPDPVLAVFDLAFIDGDHSFAGAKADLDNWGRRVRRGGRILVHDATPRFEGVLQAIEAFSREARVKVHKGREGSICTIEVEAVLERAALPRAAVLAGVLSTTHG